MLQMNRLLCSLLGYKGSSLVISLTCTGKFPLPNLAVQNRVMSIVMFGCWLFVPFRALYAAVNAHWLYMNHLNHYLPISLSHPNGLGCGAQLEVKEPPKGEDKVSLTGFVA